MNLMSKDEHELKMQERRRRNAEAAKHTGVACRLCNNVEYLFVDDLVCASSPPCRWVKCPMCGDRTTITV